MYKELMKKSTETKRLGLRSRIKLCHPNSKEFVVDGSVDCGANPERCTECSAVLETKTRDNALKALEFTDLTSIVQQNFVSQDKLGFLFPSMDDFKKRAFIPAFTNVSSELSIVERSAFRIDTKKGELEKNTQPAVGGEGAPRIVDLQFVFTLDAGDGTSTRVGVPEDTERGMYADFTHPDLLGREKDIRTVEIYVVVRSVGVIPLTGGASTPEKRIPRIADWSEEVRTFGGGFLYKLFSTTVYLRNYSREEYG